LFLFLISAILKKRQQKNGAQIFLSGRSRIYFSNEKRIFKLW